MNEVFETYLEKIDLYLNKYLPLKTNEKWQNNSFGNTSNCVTDEHLENLINPGRNLIDLGGKRWRPLLLVLSYMLAKESGLKETLSEDETYSLTPLVEYIHTASLIHDDIEDSAETRRGKPSAHITYGLDTAINAATWLYFQASVPVTKLNTDAEIKLKLMTLYTEEVRRLHLGQAMDIYWHRNPDLFPTVEEYTEMVHCKTGTLSSLAVQIGLIAGGCPEELIHKAGECARALGEGFQILDDVQNLTTGNPGKKRGDDIVEGKKSLPILEHVSVHPRDASKISRFFEKTNFEGIYSPAVEECISLLESSSSIKKAQEKGKKCITENIEALTNLFGTGETSNAAKLIKTLFNSMIPEVK